MLLFTFHSLFVTYFCSISTKTNISNAFSVHQDLQWRVGEGIKYYELIESCQIVDNVKMKCYWCLYPLYTCVAAQVPGYG